MKRNRILSVFLAIFLAISMVFTACDCGNNEEEQEVQGKQGIHGGTITETADKLISDGKTDYVLVYDKESEDEYIQNAKNIFVNFFREATKILLVEKDDSEVTYSEDLKAIVIGENTVSQSAQLTNEVKDKAEAAFQLKTKGKSIFVLGRSYGAVYGAQEILKHLFNYEYYAEYCYNIERGVTNEKLYNYDITEVPDIAEMDRYVMGIATTSSDPYYRYGIRMTRNSGTGWGSTVHNSYFHVPPNSEYVKNKGLINPFADEPNTPFDPENGYMEEHKHWYSPNRGHGYTDAHRRTADQLCYSAQDEYFDIILDKMKYTATKNNECNTIAFSFEDADVMCECDKCLAAKAKYGSQSALLMILCSKLAKALNEWLVTDEAKEMGVKRSTPMKVITLAYHATYEAPAVYNEEKGMYETTAPELEFDKNLLVQFCTRNADRFSSINSVPNASYRDNLKAWADITDKIAVWKYNQAWYGESVQWNGYFSVMQQDYQYFFENDVGYVMDEGQGPSYTNHSAFQILRGYLACNLAWDCKQDYEALIDRYFKGCYGEAAEEMRFIFDSLEANLQSKYLAGKIRGIEHHLTTTANYKKGFLENLLEVGERALAKIEPLKTSNNTEYLRMERRISSELISLRYMYLELYFEEIPADELLEMRLFYKAEATRLGITGGGYTNGNGGGLSALCERWGIA